WLNVFPPGSAPLVSRQAPDIAVEGRVPVEFEVLDAAGVRDVEPDVRLPEGGSAILLHGQLGVNPQRLVAALAPRAGQGATGVRMLDVAVRGDRAATVHTTAGDFSPGALVLATGLLPAPWGGGVPQRWIKGHMVAVAPGPWRLGSVLSGP